MAQKPTDKQISYAIKIATRLSIDLSQIEFSKYAYSKFISENKDKLRFDISDEEYSEWGGLGIGNEYFML